MVRDLEAIGISTTGMYDSESRGYRLLERSRLTPDLQRLVLIAAGNSLQYEKITDALLLQFPDFKQPPAVFYHGSSASAPSFNRSSKGSSKGSTSSSSPSGSFTSSTQYSSGKSSSKGKHTGQYPKRVFQTEQVGSDQLPAIPESTDAEQVEYQEVDEFHDADAGEHDAHETEDYHEEAGEDMDEEAVMDLANVLTVTSKRLQATVLGRKFTGRPQTVEERKKVTACTACGAIGHWLGDPECPKSAKGKGKGSSKTSKGKADGKGSSGSSSSHPKNTFVVNFPDSQSEYQEDYGTNEPYYTYMVGFPETLISPTNDNTDSFSCHLTECLDLAGYIIIDTACQRTCCGMKWLKLHDQLLHSRKLSSKKLTVSDHFQFGAGGVQIAKQRAYIPVGLQGTKQQGLLFGAGVLQLDLPLLASNTLLDMLGSVINLVEMKLHATKLGIDIPIERKHNHLVCNILNFPSNVHLNSCWQQLEDSAVWESPHPEFIAVPGVILDQKSTVQVSIQSSSDAISRTSPTASGMAPGLEDDVDQVDDTANQVPSTDVKDGEIQASTKTVAFVDGGLGRSSKTTRDCSETPDPSKGVHSPDSSSVRKSIWPVCSVQSMRSEVPVERRSTRLGALSAKVAAIACLAAAIFGNHGATSDSGRDSTEDQGQEFGQIFSGILTNFADSSLGDEARDVHPLHGGGDHPKAKCNEPLHRGGAGEHARSRSIPTGLGRSGSRKLLPLQSPGVRPGHVEDQWEFQDGMLVRHHRMPRTTLFLPDRDQCPIQISRLLPICNAKMWFENSAHQELQYNWCELQETNYEETMSPWTGCTVFKISKTPVSSGSNYATRRKLRGRLLQTAHVFAAEASIMETRTPKLRTRVDILETFAGQGNISRRCVQFGLKSLAPIDYETGWDLYRKEDQRHVDRALDQFKPLVLVQGLDCKDWCLLQDNVNYIHRLEQLWQRRARARPLVKRAAGWCAKQSRENRYWLIENPLTSRLWQEECIQQISQLPNVETAVCHGGAYGMTNSKHQLVKKSFRFMGNCEPILRRLRKKLDAEQLKQCVPIEGSETTATQVYPPEMVKAIILGARELAQQHDPDRFVPQRFVSYAVEVDRSDQTWRPILQEAMDVFGHKSEDSGVDKR